MPEITTPTPSATPIDPTTPPAPPATPPTTPPTPPAPTFDEILRNRDYQSEFDRRVAKAIATAQNKAGDPAQLTAQMAALQKQVNDYQRREEIARAGVDARYTKFVAYEVEQGLADGTDYKTALDAYLKANPQYIAPQGGNAPATSGWGQPQTTPPGGGTDGVEAAFAALNPGVKIN